MIRSDLKQSRWIPGLLFDVYVSYFSVAASAVLSAERLAQP